MQGVIDELRAGGARLVYSSSLLPSALTVLAEPAANDERSRWRAKFVPHGLAVREDSGVWLVVRREAPPPPGPEECSYACRRVMAVGESRG